MAEDMTDDWMNPTRSLVFQRPPEPPFGKIDYVIQRKRATPVTGNVAAIYRWDFWAKFDTAGERDAELTKLRNNHPMWRLRARNIDAYREYHGLPQPGDDD